MNFAVAVYDQQTSQLLCHNSAGRCRLLADRQLNQFVLVPFGDRHVLSKLERLEPDDLLSPERVLHQLDTQVGLDYPAGVMIIRLQDNGGPLITIYQNYDGDIDRHLLYDSFMVTATGQPMLPGFHYTAGRHQAYQLLSRASVQWTGDMEPLIGVLVWSNRKLAEYVGAKRLVYGDYVYIDRFEV